MSGLEADPSFEELLEFIESARGFDFTGYERPSLVRRFEQRRKVRRLTTWEEYRAVLESDPDEYAALFDTILIDDRGFFHDPPMWRFVAESVLPEVVGTETGRPIRVWSAGGARGEEAYTIAMLLAEALPAEEFRARVRIYATDADEAALAIGRHASFPAASLENVPEPFRERYFEHDEDTVTVRPELRRAVIFGRHDLLHDPPISHVDLLTARNTLLYFDPDAQTRILAGFHFALRDRGFLFLGKFQLLSRRTKLFVPVDPSRRVFGKAPGTAGEAAVAKRRRRLSSLVTDDQGVVIEASREAAALLRIRSALLPGKPLADLVVEADRPAFRTMLAATAQGAGDRTGEIRVRRSDGVVRVVELTASAVVESGSSGIRLGWRMRDVTERTQTEARLWELNAELEHGVRRRTAQLEAEQTRLRVVLEHLPAGVVLAQADGRISWQNPDAVRLLGELRSIDDLHGFRVDGKPRASRDWPLSRAVLHGEVCLDELIEVDVDGERCIIEVAASPIFGREGTRIGALMRAEDVTGRERRERAEREFIANAAHELRTPLTAIVAAVEVLQSGAKELPEERDRFIGHIERECERLARVGGALLTLARAEARQEAPRIELVQLRPLLEELASDLHPPEAITVRVECAETAATPSNTDLLRQALWNLASNALRYTKHGEVVLAVEPISESEVGIVVRDTGPGIPKDVQSRVFERFVRGGRQGADGYGLGLGIAARSAEAVGGRLELSSGSQGTSARIVVPAARMLTEARP